MKTQMKFSFLSLAAACVLALTACGGDPAPEAPAPAPVTALIGGSIQGRALSLTATVTTQAGSSRGSADGAGSAAQFFEPAHITTDGTNLYLADTDNHRIRRVVIATGEVTTLAGSMDGFVDGNGTAAQFRNPKGITTDGINIYTTDQGNHSVRKIVIATGEVTTMAGDGTRANTDGVGSAAQFDNPTSITTDGTNLYVSDQENHRIRKVVIATNEVTTLAGSSQGTSDGIGSAAQFDTPAGIATDGTNLYVGEFSSRIRKVVIATGEVTTLAGSTNGFTDGIGTAAQFGAPQAITTDGTNLYVADANNRIRKLVISTGEVTTVAGSAAGFVDGPGAAAQFSNPAGITTDGKSLYVSDSRNNRVRKIQ